MQKKGVRLVALAAALARALQEAERVLVPKQGRVQALLALEKQAKARPATIKTGAPQLQATTPRRKSLRRTKLQRVVKSATRKSAVEMTTKTANCAVLGRKPSP